MFIALEMVLIALGTPVDLECNKINQIKVLKRCLKLIFIRIFQEKLSNIQIGLRRFDKHGEWVYKL